MDNKTITMPYSEYKELLEEAHNTTYKKFGKTEEEIKNIISTANDKDKIINELNNGRDKLQDIIERSFEEKKEFDKAIDDLVSINNKLQEQNRNLIKENTILKKQHKPKKWYQFWK